MALPRPVVLILSSDPAFSRQLTESWAQAGAVPEFVMLGMDLCQELRSDSYDLAVADADSPEKHQIVKPVLEALGRPAILVGSGAMETSKAIQSCIVEVPREQKVWTSTVAVLGREILGRESAETRARTSDCARAEAEAQAMLGRYMVEMRNNVNNAITSVLGNAELLLLEPGLPAPVQAQADTIRNMALRLNEVFQRFSSIEKELNVAARETGKQSEQSRTAQSHRG